MKKLSKITAAVLAAVLAVVMCILPAGAESIFTSSKSIESGKTYSFEISNSQKTLNYKIKVENSGELKVDAVHYFQEVSFSVFDKDGEFIEPDSANVKTGEYIKGNKTLHWDKKTEAFKGTLTYTVKPGTYYIQFTRSWSQNGKGKFCVTAPEGDGAVSENNSSLTLKFTMSKGDKITLGALASGKEADLTWSSSKTSVAKVTSKGKVSAAGKGTATLTAKSGGKTVLTVIVEVQ